MNLFGGKPYLFRFYTAGETDYSRQTVRDIITVLNVKIPGKYKLEIINVLFQARTARADGIISTPSLARIRPAPIKRYFGRLYSVVAINEVLADLGWGKMASHSERPGLPHLG